MVCRTPPL